MTWIFKNTMTENLNFSQMNHSYKFVIDGIPKAQKQTRFRMINGRPMCYDPSKKDKSAIQKSIATGCPSQPLEWPLELTIMFYMPIPKGTSRAERERMIRHVRLPDKKPDEDNLAYLVTNALKGYVYDDDRRIVAKHVYKLYGTKPRTVIKVTPIFSLENYGFPDATDL